MFGWALDIAYAAALTASSPLWVYRRLRHGRYRDGWGQRFGAAPRTYGLQPVIWLHGVSLGEVNALRTLVAEIHRQLPDYRVVVSSTTDTGMAAARRLFAPDHAVFHWPMDFTWAVRRAISRVRPSLVVLMEGEVWPNFLAACNGRGIPAVVVNGRMSPDKGYPRYRRLGPLARKLFGRLSAIGVQDEAYAERFRSLGVPADKVVVTGMMKFDAVSADDPAGTAELSAALGLQAGDRLIVAGGTGGGEEAIVLDAFQQLKAEFPRVRLAIVPRKPERFEEVARLIEQRGLKLVRRSEHPDGSPPPAGLDEAVILGDTMGELRKFYALAECIFVGRSLAPMGGSDMIEAAALGRPTCFGPHTYNFPQADALAENGCARVADAAGLRDRLRQWLGDPAAALAGAQAARRHILSQRGSTQRNVEMICRVLGRTPAVRQGDIATEAIGCSNGS